MVLGVRPTITRFPTDRSALQSSSLQGMKAQALQAFFVGKVIEADYQSCWLGGQILAFKFSVINFVVAMAPSPVLHR